MELMFLLTTSMFFAIMVVLSIWVVIVTTFFLKFSKTQNLGEKYMGVSVVIPAYNEEKNIAKCVESINNSKYPKSKLEIVVVDDGSTDKTVDICKSLGVKVLKQNHKGKVAALNNGINKSVNDFIIIMDADTTVDPFSIKEIIKHMDDKNIGAVSGIAKVLNKKNLLGLFQNVEYAYLQFMRETISRLLGTSPGICGAFTCFRKDALKQAGGFNKRTSAEDFDVALHIKKAGYKIIVESKAIAYTIVPQTMHSLFKQRFRWTKGILQSIFLHKDIIGRSPSASYVLGVHFFWYVIALFSIPLIAYNVLYWLPLNSATPVDTFLYFFRWFSFAGIIHMIYMIPQWGINIVYIFGIIAGIMTFFLMYIALRRYGEKLNFRNFLGLFFYFPYTLLLNLTLIGGIFYFVIKKGKGNFS